MQKQPAKRQDDHLRRFGKAPFCGISSKIADGHDESEYGDLVDAQLGDGQWVTGEVVNLNKGQYLIRYDGTRPDGSV
jgi:hypothetical protein